MYFGACKIQSAPSGSVGESMEVWWLAPAVGRGCRCEAVGSDRRTEGAGPVVHREDSQRLGEISNEVQHGLDSANRRAHGCGQRGDATD